MNVGPRGHSLQGGDSSLRFLIPNLHPICTCSCLFTPLTEGRSARDLTQAATSQKKGFREVICHTCNIVAGEVAGGSNQGATHRCVQCLWRRYLGGCHCEPSKKGHPGSAVEVPGKGSIFSQNLPPQNWGTPFFFGSLLLGSSPGRSALQSA